MGHAGYDLLMVWYVWISSIGSDQNAEFLTNQERICVGELGKNKMSGAIGGAKVYIWGGSAPQACDTRRLC